MNNEPNQFMKEVFKSYEKAFLSPPPRQDIDVVFFKDEEGTIFRVKDLLFSQTPEGELENMVINKERLVPFTKKDEDFLRLRYMLSNNDFVNMLSVYGYADYYGGFDKTIILRFEKVFRNKNGYFLRLGVRFVGDVHS